MTDNTRWYILPSSIRRTFVYIQAFAERVDRDGPEVSELIEQELLRNLEAGQVIPGAGGLRKIRVTDPRRGKGKRGGYRVIYLDLPEAGQVHLVHLFDKGQKEDISSDEKRILRAMAERIKKGARKDAQD